MSNLTVSFSGYVLSLSWIRVSFILIKGVLSSNWIHIFFILIESVLSSSWIQVSFILIEGVCSGLGEFYGL